MKTHTLSFKNFKSVQFVTAIILLWGLADALVSFFLPIQMERFLQNLTLFGILFAVSSVAGALADPILGFISSRARYVVLLLVGLALSLALLGLANVPFSTMLIVWLMVIWGLYYEFINIGIFNYVSRYHNEREQSGYFGTIYLFLNLAYVIGPLLGGYLVVYGSRVIYGTAALFVLLALTLLPKVIGLHKHRELPLIGYQELRRFEPMKQLKNYRKVWSYAAVFFIAVFLYNVWDSFVWTLVPVESIGGSAIFAGIITSVFTIPLVLFEGYGGKIADRFGRNLTFVVGLFVAALFTLIFGLQDAVAPKLLAAAVSALGFAFAYPALMGETSRDGQDHKAQLGSVAGFQRLFVNAGYILGPIGGGVLASHFGIQRAFFVLGVVMLVCFVPMVIAMVHFRIRGRTHHTVSAEFDL